MVCLDSHMFWCVKLVSSVPNMNEDIKTSDLMYGNRNQHYQRSVNNRVG